VKAFGWWLAFAQNVSSIQVFGIVIVMKYGRLLQWQGEFLNPGTCLMVV
jgi:hypothetical protein